MKEELIRITFKNVRQGDCILIEWKNNLGEWQIGMIDCNYVKEAVPSITKEILGKYKKLSFLLLSHPHKDHYSGICSVLDYCKANNIAIDYILDTFSFDPHEVRSDLPENAKFLLYQSLAGAEQDTEPLKGLQKLFQTIDWWVEQGTDYGTVRSPGNLGEMLNFNLPNDLCFYLHAPADLELTEYVNHTFFAKSGVQKLIPDAKSGANLLSTILHISTQNWQTILTSDAEIITFDRLLKQPDKPDSSKKLLIAQIPHHGSEKNHAPEFWDEYLSKTDTIAIISAGKNDHHKHPSKEVVKYFDDKSKAVRCTNFVHGYADFYPQKKTISNEPDMRLAMLDAPLNITSQDCGEQRISIGVDGVVY